MNGLSVVSWDSTGSNVAWEKPGGRVENDVEFRVAARLENLAVLRTLIAAVATFEDLDMDSVADLRLAVDEACTRLIRSATSGATLVVSVQPSEHHLKIDASTVCTSTDIMAPGSFSWHVLSSLTDEVTTFQDGQVPGEGGVFGISMTTRRVGSLR